MNDIVVLPLRNGEITLVDADTEHIWGGKGWTVNKGYVRRGTKPRGGKYRTISLHREIVGAQPGEVVDHINHNRKDNRKANLRIVTSAQNTAHRSVETAKSVSNLLGVNPYRDGRWRARLKGRHIGYFDTPEEAATARDAAALREYGEFACLNFPERKEVGA